MIKKLSSIVALALVLTACWVDSASDEGSIASGVPEDSQVPGLVGEWRQGQRTTADLTHRALLRIGADGTFDLSDTVGKSPASGSCTRTWGVWERRGDSLILDARKAERSLGGTWHSIRAKGRSSGFLRMVGDSLVLTSARVEPTRLERVR
ncbi:MAG: hypothetical protein RL318_525 [Fibrobacterota bacterium]